MEKDTRTKKLPGFYIALCCCVIAIGVAGFIIQGNDTKTTDLPTVVEETTMPELAYEETMPEEFAEPVDEVIAPQIAEDIIDSVPAEPPVEDYAYDNPDILPASVVVSAEESCNFTAPLPDMTVKFGFVTDTLMYNECYGDWRTHNGIDVEAPLGCSVSASSSGTVIDVSKGSYGNSVTIEHPGGFKSVYAQLGEVSVNVGDIVEQGSVIGTVGESMGENLKEPHLHYELYKNETPVNPEEY